MGAQGGQGGQGGQGQKGQKGQTGAQGGQGGQGGQGSKGQKGEVGGTGGTGSKGQKGELGASYTAGDSLALSGTEFSFNSNATLVLNNILDMTGTSTGGYPFMRMRSSSVSTYPRIEFGYGAANSSTASLGKIKYVNSSTTASQALTFQVAGSETARLTGGGYLLVGKTSTSTADVGGMMSPGGTITATQSVAGSYGGLSLRNNSGTDSFAGFTCYNGLATLSTSATSGGGHSLCIAGGLDGEYARFTNAKRLGIGTTAPAQALHVVGSIIATGNITAYYSDERLKDLQGAIPNALDKVNKLTGYYYTPNDLAVSLGVDNEGLEVGVSAQEVEAVLPEIVTKSAIGKNYKTVQYDKLTPLLIEAVKELTQKVKDLETKISEMEK